MLNEDAARRFWGKVAKGEPMDCWPWTGHQHIRGYGIFWLDGKNVRANRIALMQKELPPFADAMALHECDNPVCCNPRHLRWGTAKDNMDDRVLRRGDLKGENSPKAQVTNETVDRIYALRLEGLTCREIAADLGLSYVLVMNIYTGKSWQHRLGVDGNPTVEQLRASKPKRKRKAPNRILTDAMVDRIFQGRFEGLSAAQLAKELGLPKGTVSPVHCGLVFSERLGRYGNPTLEQLRAVKGVNPTYKLTPDDVLEIRSLLAEGYIAADIARKYGVSPATLSRIKNSAA